MLKTTETNGQIDAANIAKLIERCNSNEHLLFSLRSEQTMKAIFFFCDEDGAKEIMEKYYAEFSKEGFICKCLEMTPEEIREIILSLEVISSDAILYFYFECWEQLQKKLVASQADLDFQN